MYRKHLLGESFATDCEYDATKCEYNATKCKRFATDCEEKTRQNVSMMRQNVSGKLHTEVKLLFCIYLRSF